jgi:hypothetical protein
MWLNYYSCLKFKNISRHCKRHKNMFLELQHPVNFQFIYCAHIRLYTVVLIAKSTVPYRKSLRGHLYGYGYGWLAPVNRRNVYGTVGIPSRHQHPPPRPVVVVSARVVEVGIWRVGSTVAESNGTLCEPLRAGATFAIDRRGRARGGRMFRRSGSWRRFCFCFPVPGLRLPLR